ncbi:MAG: cytidine deaminase, partial [Paramuribaculum sp.]|nr:cytidine deaminase [Paramuribaculum sp.]
MKDFEIKINVAVSTLDSLPPEDRALCESAIEATSRAYAPYSNFNVGAAILLSNGEVITGAHQENAAFPSGPCAAR